MECHLPTTTTLCYEGPSKITQESFPHKKVRGQLWTIFQKNSDLHSVTRVYMCDFTGYIGVQANHLFTQVPTLNGSTKKSRRGHKPQTTDPEAARYRKQPPLDQVCQFYERRHCGCSLTAAQRTGPGSCWGSSPIRTTLAVDWSIKIFKRQQCTPL